MNKLGILSVLLCVCFFAGPVSADLVHRYRFDTDASDSVGSAHGTLMNGAMVSAGQAVLDGSDDFIDLPGAAIAIPAYSALTLELWSTQPAIDQDFSMTAAFGDTWGNGLGRDYLMISTTRGNQVSRAAIANTPDDTEPWNDEVGVNGPELNDGLEHHYVLTIDGSELAYYIDGDLQDTVSLGSATISGLSNAYAYLGKGLYTADGTVQCSINEFRIYDSALSALQIQQHTAWGPDTISAPLVEITETDGKTVLFVGNPAQTDLYEIVLLAQPTANVYVTVSPPAGLSVGNGDGVDAVLTFTTADWNLPQTVTVEMADPGASFGATEVITHAIQSADPEYDASPVYNVWVSIQEDECGVWGYAEGDYNLDCFVNLEDFAILAGVWLATEAPLDLQMLAGDWLQNTLLYDEQMYARSIQKTDQPFFVDTTTVVNTVDEKVYGHFLEHIYHSVNGGLWGELVWNRSFELAGDGGGVWTIEGSDLVQSSLATDVHLDFGDLGWSDYEITLEARKDGGNEAFLILFRAPDSDNFYWCNLGGWGNTQHAIEKEVNGGRSVVSPVVSGSLSTGVWYEIRIRCEGNRFQVWLDGDPIFDYTDTNGPYLSGRIGLGTWSTQARYRNIQVTEIPSSTVLFSGLPALPGNEFAATSWTVFGGGQATLDTDALNDDYSVQIAAAAGGTGLQQDHFKLIPQLYSGSVWMKGSLPAGLVVEFLDGTTVLGQASLGAPTSTWAEYPFQITPSAATDQGSLRITLQGAGTVRLDQVSLMGQDAAETGGFRPDLLQAVDDLRPPIIRWPGGCFASLYLWKDAIGPQHQRRQYAAYMWDDQDTNSYGTDEFLRMCEVIDSEPLLVINTGILDSACGAPAQFKLPAEESYVDYALDWMEYCNGDAATTYWGSVRAANGHPEPYHVVYWEIDNETWAAGVSAYIDVIQEFAPAMRAKADALGVPIKLIACGGSGLDMNWNQSVINSCATLIDYISVHNYDDPSEYKSGPADYEAFLITLGNAIAASDNPDMKIYNSEWNAQSTDWRTGLYAGGILNVYERTGDVFEIGGPALFLRHTSAGDWDNAFINFDHTGWFPAPNYVVMKLWRDHYAPYRVETTGADTNLNVTTVMSEDEKTLHIRVVNPDAGDKSLAFEIDASFVPETAVLHYVAPGSLYARNTLANPNTVHVEAKVVGLSGQVLRLRMPGYSAGVITVQTSRPHATKLLYSSFRDNGQDGLHLAYSEDGLTWTALKGDASFLTPQIGGNLMRDPSIVQGPDGVFHMVWTTGWWDKGIGLAHSPDLINWSSQTFLPVMAHEPDARNCWAPEIFYDDATDQFLIVWSTTIDGAFPETYNPNDDNNHRLYYVATSDFVTYTPTQLFYDPGFNVIDGFVAKDNGRYVLFIKHESKDPVVEKNIRVAYADAAAGPYGPASASISPAWVEGPSSVRIGAQWHLYFDGYTRGRMEGQTSSDLNGWTDITSQLSFPSGTRHGTVFRVTEEVLNALLAL